MTTAVIAEALEGLAEPVGKVKPHPENPRRGDVAGIATSLQRFGQVRPILVQASTSYIVAGNHTYQAARSLGWKRIAVARVEMTDVEARAYMLADNRWSDVAENDDVALAAILEGLEHEGGLEGTGYSPGDADDLKALIAQLPDAPIPDAPPAGDGNGGHPGRIGKERVPVNLTMTSAQKDTFSADLTRLRAEWGTVGVTETLLRAVAECIERLG
jgi:hypothetical protein